LETPEEPWCLSEVEIFRDLSPAEMAAIAAAAPRRTYAEQVMEPGPTTVRPSESAEALLERMARRDVPAVLVSIAQGRLLGLAYQEDLRRLVAGKQSLSRLDRRYPSGRRNRAPR
jgi:CBS domain-containing protein